MELIDREEAKREFNAGFGGVSHAVAAGHILDSIEAIDPVHAAGGCYCQECVYYMQLGKGYVCERDNFYLDMLPYDFCRRGKPKE